MHSNSSRPGVRQARTSSQNTVSSLPSEVPLDNAPPAAYFQEDWRPDPASPLPLHVQISSCFSARISSGAWPPGMRLAPQRELCRLLGVNRSTLATALGTLAGQGLIEGRRGGGTRVAAEGNHSNNSTATGSWSDYLEEGTHYPNLPAVQAINRLEFEPGLIRLGTGEPAPELLPGEAMNRVLAELAARPLPPLAYEEPLGNSGLRSAVSHQLLKQGIQADPGSVLITSGALQGLQLIALGLLPRSSTILLEKPSYLYSIHAFQSAGIKFSGLPVDESGMVVSRLAAEAMRTKAAMLYTIPSFHNPTGIVMDEARRQELMAVSGGLRLPILEDGAYQELWLDAPPPLPLKALDCEGRVLHLGTLSKAASPGLRIGWIVGPEPVIRRLADIKMQTDYGASSLSQMAAARWLDGGYHEEHLTLLRGRLRERRALMLQLLDAHFRGLASWSTPAGGFYIWLSLHRLLPLRRLFESARRAGLLLNTGDLYDRGDSRHLRLSYAYARPEQMHSGIHALAAIIKQVSNDK